MVPLNRDRPHLRPTEFAPRLNGVSTLREGKIMDAFEFFSRLVEAARLYREELKKLLAEDPGWVLVDHTGRAANAANAAFAAQVANPNATAWDDAVAHTVMWVAETATHHEEYDYRAELEKALHSAYEKVVEVVGK